MHIIIFDEIDAIGKIRGQGSSHHDDKVLTRLLTMIDGVDSFENIFIIGITNRKDVLDKALIRSGRLGFHMEIPLPTESGRKEILDIYIDPLKKNNLADVIDTQYLAKLLDGCSGADISSLVSRAKNFALLRNCKIDDNSIKANKSSEITEIDIIDAFKIFQSTFSKNDEYVKKYVTNYPLDQEKIVTDIVSAALENISYSRAMVKPYLIENKLFQKCKSLLEFTKVTEDIRAIAFLEITFAVALNFPYIKYLSYNEFLGKNSNDNCHILTEIYVNCLQAEKAVLILDSLPDVGDRALEENQG